MGIQVEVLGTAKLADIKMAMERLADSGLRAELLDSIGAVAESQTRRRITDEKASPGGEPWQDWSTRYAKTRHGNQSLLQGNGDLLDSVTFVVERDRVHVGRRCAMRAFTRKDSAVACRSAHINVLSARRLAVR